MFNETVLYDIKLFKVITFFKYIKILLHVEIDLFLDYIFKKQIRKNDLCKINDCFIGIVHKNNFWIL